VPAPTSSPDQHEHGALRDRIVEEMTAALVTVSDSYRARRRQLLADRQLTVTGRLLAEASAIEPREQ